MSAILQIAGLRFGMLTVIRRAPSRGGRSRWVCRCDCGTVRHVKGNHLKSGNTASCGCLHTASIRSLRLSHGLSGTRVGRSWQGMMQRCFDRKCEAFVNYGGRGITVCEGLRRSPEALRRLIGDRPKGLTIERVNNDGNYSCGTCNQCRRNKWPLNLIWTTRAEQNRNRRNVRKVS